MWDLIGILLVLSLGIILFSSVGTNTHNEDDDEKELVKVVTKYYKK
jgi:hypothetical protein